MIRGKPSGTLKNRNGKKDEWDENSYEACEVIELGKTEEVILGYKPTGCLDAILGMNFYYWPVVDDIDESDE